MSSSASQAHAFHQPVCHRLSWLHPWSVPCVHTSRALSPSGWGPDPQCQAVQVAHWTWWWQCLVVWRCRSFWSLPCHSAADVGGLALSMAKSHWYGTLHFAHKSCTCGHILKERWWEERTGSSSLNFFQAVFPRVVVESSKPLAAESMPPRQQKEATTSSLSGSTWTPLYGLLSKGLCISVAPCKSVIRVLWQVLEPTAFLMHPVLAAIAEDAVAPVQQMAHGNLSELCRRSRPLPQIMVFVFPVFTLSPFSSIASFQVKGLLTHSSNDSAMITMSSP